MRIRVRGTNLKAAAAQWRTSSKKFASVVERNLQKIGDEVVLKFKLEAYAGKFGPPKKRGPGPPLIKTGNYVNSFRAEASGTNLGIGSTGMNENMSNEALGELLEFGKPELGIEARPHIRIMQEWLNSKISTLGNRIVKDLLP